MGSLDRGGHGGRDGYGERAESRPPSLEQLIQETRAERDAFRCDPANWDKVDPTNFPERKRYAGESKPWTAEELAAIEAFPGDEWDPPGKGFTASLERTREVAHPDRGPDVERPADGESEVDRTYRGTEDIREGLLSGKSVSEVKRELLDQPGDPPEEKTTELVRTEGDLRYELGSPIERPDEPTLEVSGLGEGKSTRDKVSETLRKPKMVQDIEQSGDLHLAAWEGVAGPPRATGAYVGTPSHPVVHAPPTKADGGAVAIAPIVFYLLLDQGVRSLKSNFNEWRQSRGERGNAGD